MRPRAVISPHADPILTGCGFALAFGWLWSAGFGELWRDGVAESLAIRSHEGLLALTLGAGCVLFGCTGFMRWNRPHLSAALAHGGALLCLGLSCVVNRPSIGTALIGLAGAGLGTYWISRMLVLKPAQAVASLACASCASMFIAWTVSIPPPGAGIAIGAAGCFVAAWLFALALIMRTVKTGHDIAFESSEQAWGKRAVTLCIALWLPFFALGVMYAIPVSPAGSFAVMTAHLAGAALAVPVLYRIFRTASTDDGIRLTIVIAICALFFAGFCQLLFPSFATLALDIGAAFVEAACLAGFIALICRSGLVSNPGNIPRLAGLFLAALLLAVKMGHWAGYGVMQAHGISGTALFVVMLILLMLAFAFVNLPAFRVAAQQRPEHATSRNIAVPDVQIDSTKLRKEFAERLNPKERIIAALLVQGYTNKNIAECLSVTEDAVRWRIKNLNRKTGATSRQQLLDILTESNPSV